MLKLIMNFELRICNEATTNHTYRSAIAFGDIGAKDVGVGFHYDLYPIANRQ